MSRRRRSTLADVPEVINKNVEKAREKAATKFAEMFIPNVTGWDFYDHFAKCPQSQAAFRNETISITDTHLDKYLGVARKEILAANRKQLPPDPIPEYLRKLISIQDLSGKFLNMVEVLKCFEMPENLTLKRNPGLYQEWERATSLAIAGFRQHVEIFEYIHESHDKAMLWLRSNELVYEARDLLFEFSFTQPQPKKLPPWQTPLITTHIPSETIIEPPLSIPIRIIEPTEPINNDNDEDKMEPISTDEYLAAELASLRQKSPPGSAGFTNLANKLSYLHGEVDAEKLEQQRLKVEASEQLVIIIFQQIEMLIKEISLCLIRCVHAYNNCELFTDRYLTFDELTARLGDGNTGSPAYFDWRQHDTPGLRPIILDFCSAVQSMADDRLALQEISQPIGRDWSVIKINQLHNQNRYNITFHNENLVLKVLHYLDFLRKSRELNDWYGPGYYFVANPLSLPFTMHTALHEFKLKEIVEDHLNSIPHEKHGFCDVQQRQSSWTYQHKLNEFRRSFSELSACSHSFNWPVLPTIREEKVCEQLFTSLCVFFICCESSIANSYQWEKKFITKISSQRGQSTYLIGEANLRENKQLSLPKEEDRKPRIVMMKKIFEARSNRRRSSANSSTLLPAAALAARNRSVSFMSLINEQDDDGTNDKQNQAIKEDVPKAIPRSDQPRRETIVAKAKQFQQMVLAASTAKRHSTPQSDAIVNKAATKSPSKKTMMRKSSTAPSTLILKNQQQKQQIRDKAGFKEDEVSLASLGSGSIQDTDKEPSEILLSSTISSNQLQLQQQPGNIRLENARKAAIAKRAQQEAAQSKFIISRKKLSPSTSCPSSPIPTKNRRTTAGALVLPSIKNKDAKPGEEEQDKEKILQLKPVIDETADNNTNVIEKKVKSPPRSSKGKRKSTIVVVDENSNNNPDEMLVEQQQLQSLSRADLFKESMQSKRVSRVHSSGSNKQYQLNPLVVGASIDVSQSLSTISDGLESKKRTTKQKKMTKRSSIALPLPVSVSGGSAVGSSSVNNSKR